MNIVQLAMVMEKGQKAYSKELETRIMFDGYKFRVAYSHSCTDDLICETSVLLADDWEIEREYISFWDAWNTIKSGSGTMVYGDIHDCTDSSTRISAENLDKNMAELYLTPEMINGEWYIVR